MALVLDTGPVLALLDANDAHHERCVRMVDEVDEPLVVAVTVLVEVDHWVRRRLDAGVWQVFVEDIADGAYRLAALDEGDLVRAAALEAQYADLGRGCQWGAARGSPLRARDRQGHPVRRGARQHAVALTPGWMRSEMMLEPPLAVSLSAPC